ncbi:MAG: TIR domain-containing protein [Muribaculaceae bacterium]|nr:TIR domain-containing protein [Muribaculaceae bacterium]
MNSKGRIFISYSRNDKDIVLPLIKEIDDLLNTECWIDLNDISIGSFFDDDIRQAIEDCEMVLFMLSDNSINSDWTRKEIIYAQNEKKRIIPIVIDGKGLRGWFKFNFPHIDYIDISSKEQREKLFDSLIHLYVENVHFKDKGTNNIKGYTGGTPPYIKIGTPWLKRNMGCTIAVSIVCLLVLAFIPFNHIYRHQSQVDTSIPVETSTTEAKYDCRPIDLGLPSGTIWGDRNLGAYSSSDFGELFAWGEITTKDDYSQGNYNAADKPKGIIFSAQFDASTNFLGEKWSIPTEKQFQELIDKCQWSWKQNNGHYGFDVVGPNGNKIFLPACGWICSTQIDYQNKFGYYWTAERSTSNPQLARSLRFSEKEKAYMANGYLYYGRGIRPVYK